MKQYLAAICHNESELETYTRQLQKQGFESLSEVKKAEDGTFYKVMAKTEKSETLLQEKDGVIGERTLPA